MKSLFTFVFSISTTFLFGQVGTWPVETTYLYFGANELGQSVAGNYALLQDKTNGLTFLNSPLEIRFRIANNDKMFLSSSGFFGIGTTTPGAPLHVRHTGSGSHFSIETNATGEGDLTWFQGGIAATNQRAAFQVNAYTGDFEAYVYNNSQWINWLSVNRSAGNVGIGTSSTDAKLDIAGRLKIESTNEVELGGGITKEANAGKIAYQKFSDGLDIVGAGTTGTNRKIKFWNEGGAMFTGNVGIGTASPDEALTVKGKVHTQEVKVDLNGVIAPDYVFEKDYNLLSLEEIKTYIDQNKHLPEVSSAKEMEANGIQLGEMNMLLLKKIEELTLYVIELKKENEVAKEKAEIMQRDINQLKK